MSTLTGTTTLVRLALRRDRIRLPVWIVTFAGMAASAAAATVAVYPTALDRRNAAESINSVPSLVAFYGPVYEPTLGATSVFKLTAFGSAMIGLLMILTMVRHTRAEEEAGRFELLGATVLGRSAGLAAGLVVTAGASAALGLCTAVGLVAAGLPVAGSVTFGLGWMATGLVFGALAALTAQLARGGRAASGLAVVALGAAYFLRAIGDSAGPRWLSWLSPIGWAQQARPYAGDRWWVLLLPVAVAILLSAGAVRLAHVRDAGTGLLPERAGRPAAGRTLSGAWGLVWRLNRGTFAAWAAGFLVLGLVAGNLSGNVGKLIDSPQARALIASLGGEQGMSDAFLAAEFSVAAVVTAAYAVAIVARLRTEERSAGVDGILAAAVSRRHLLSGYLLFALAAPAVLLAVSGAAAGLAAGAGSGHIGSEVLRLAGAALSGLPAVWVLTGLAVALFGVIPRAVNFAWVALTAFLVIGEFGALLKVAPWVLDLSPFTHLPRLPGTAPHVMPLLWLTALGLALAVAGVLGFRHRDLNA